MTELTYLLIEPQILPHEAKARASSEAKSTYPPVDPSADREHNTASLTTLLQENLKDLIYFFER